MRAFRTVVRAASFRRTATAYTAKTAKSPSTIWTARVPRIKRRRPYVMTATITMSKTSRQPKFRCASGESRLARASNTASPRHGPGGRGSRRRGARQRASHPQIASGLRDIVDADERGAGGRGEPEGGEGARQPLARGRVLADSREAADEALPRGADGDRKAQGPEGLQVAQEQQASLGTLAEAEARID